MPIPCILFSEFSCNGVHGLDSVLVLRAQTRGFADVPTRQEVVRQMRMCCARPDKYVYIYRITKGLLGLQGPRRERSGGGTCHYVMLSSGW
jgi:hypothetical protein